MTSKAKAAANRRNAQHSTGPRTPAGKAAIAKNNLRHGLYSATVVLPGEDPAEFQKLHGEYLAFYQPRDLAELDQVEQLAAAKWRLRRIALLEAEFMREKDSVDIDRRLAAFNRASQCQARILRQWNTLRKDLDALRLSRQAAPHQAQSGAAPGSEPVPAGESDQDNDDHKWATAEEWRRQRAAKPRNYKPPKAFELSWRPDPDGPEKVIARVYKGKHVDKFPDQEDD
ncbi:MAG TPA: hypothetical protein VMI94_18635 [Bryobacteraceae bacterium]|nr:hypothetical protein [Bryobacteraceae bacterium]